MSIEHPLDNAAWLALTSHHEGFAESKGRARRYPSDVSPFSAVDSIDAESLRDLSALIGEGEPCAIFRGEVPPLPAGWTELTRGAGSQMTVTAATLADGEPAPVRLLGPDDVEQMLDLTARTKPGPFLPRTIELGRYYGHFIEGRLVAMAGERMHLEGFTEISAVCTDPEARGRGLAAALTRHVALGILERGEQPFLHVAAGNDNARRVYESLGFEVRREIAFVLAQPPA